MQEPKPIPRPSFEAWLEQKYGVKGKSENTQKIGDIHKGDYINYVFNSKEKAQNFLNAFQITATAEQLNRFQQVGQKQEALIFPDPLHPEKFALLIDSVNHAKIKEAYHQEINGSQYQQRTPQEIQAQIDAIDARLDILTVKFKEGAKGRLENLQKLASNTKEGGWHDLYATSAFQLSLQNFIALNMDSLSENELSALQETSRKLMRDDGSVAEGLKQDENWYYYLRTVCNHSTESIIPVIKEDTKHLLNGVENRLVIDHITPTGKPLTAQVGEKKRKIPRFLPDPDNAGKSETDEILITSGGMAGHRTITKIWKREIEDKPGQYDYFQTEYNAGAGCDWAAYPGPNNVGGYKTGVAWTVSTKPIKPPVNEETLTKLITAQRMIMFYKQERPTWDTENTLEGFSEPDSTDAKSWKAQKAIIDSCLGERMDNLSQKGAPQLSGNCSVMSLNVYLSACCQEKLDGSKNISEEHWRHAKANGYHETVAALEAKRAVLVVKKAAAEEKAVAAPNNELRDAPKVNMPLDIKTTLPLEIEGRIQIRSATR